MADTVDVRDSFAVSCAEVPFGESPELVVVDGRTASWWLIAVRCDRLRAR